MDLLHDRLAIVDVETTGAGAACERLTEVAVLEVEGFTLRSRWSSLVNPGRPLSAGIEALTGITEEMLSGAPRFPAIAKELYERLQGRLFVAHNAAFDFGVLRQEFSRAGYRFDPETLCTVRLARRLYPRFAGHDLDSLIERHALSCRLRHRAEDDADALWQFLLAAERDHGPEVLGVAARLAVRALSLPPTHDREEIESLADAPGVYLLYGANDELLYVGAAKSLRSGVLAHFAAARSARSARLAKQVRRVETQRTVGELGAALLRAKLLEEYSPEFNRRSARARTQEAPPWPHRGPVGIVERDFVEEKTEVHVVDGWRYLGTAANDAELAELLEARSAPFDWRRYRILARELGRPGVRLVALAR